jgi:hypothetical protein
MNSGGHRFFTVVTIITMIFAPVFSHHKWAYQLIGVTSETHNVTCVVNQPCPKQKTTINYVYPPLPTAPPPTPKPAKVVKNDTVHGKGYEAPSP